MPLFTALLHTANDALRLGRALETLRPCSEILIVDHHSDDSTLHIAHTYGARIIHADPDTSPGHFIQLAKYHWILCLDPHESITETLEASLFEWRELPSSATGANAYSITMREETTSGWRQQAAPHTRLVPRHWNQWRLGLPADDPAASLLQGDLLRFAFP
jgi:glycosyltransferase involved in cell wall biosynthesis